MNTQGPTEFDLARNLMRLRFRRNFVLNNYTPGRWWEADVFELTPAGFFREYEIKMTVADFVADRGKQRQIADNRVRWSDAKRMESKHALLARGSEEGPIRFWYVTPAGLLKPEQLPPWAGLIEMRPQGTGFKYMQEVEIRKGPRLHGERLEPKIAEHARSVLYWRLHGLMQTRNVMANAEEFDATTALTNSDEPQTVDAAMEME